MGVSLLRARLVLPTIASAMALAIACGLAPSPARAAAPPENGVVVHIGDSFVDAVRYPLGEKFRAEKTMYIPLARTSSYLGTWLGPTRPIDELKWKHHPSLVIITLGANEHNAPAASRVALVRQIVRAVQPVPCVWLSFVPWKGMSTDLSEMIKREAAPCRHYDSAEIAEKVQRQADGAHPTHAGGAVWADAFFEWLKTERDPAKPPWGLKPATR